MNFATGTAFSCLIIFLIQTQAAWARTLFIIRNSTFICQEGDSKFKRIDLTEDDKMALLEAKGVPFLTPYMAINKRLAEENFINPLPLPTIKDTKKTLFSRKSALLAYLNAIVEKENAVLKELIKDSGSNTHQQLPTPAKDPASRRGHYNEHAAPPILSQHHSKAAFRDVPYALPHEIGHESSYISKTTGERTTLEYCFERGSFIDNGEHLRMCTTCSITNSLEDGYLPSVLNEAICHPEDSSCVYVNEFPEGTCKESQILIKVLKKREGYCSLASKNNETVTIDEWEVQDYPLNVGCECAIHKQSIFAPYL